MTQDPPASFLCMTLITASAPLLSMLELDPHYAR